MPASFSTADPAEHPEQPSMSHSSGWPPLVDVTLSSASARPHPLYVPYAGPSSSPSPRPNFGSSRDDPWDHVRGRPPFLRPPPPPSFPNLAPHRFSSLNPSNSFVDARSNQPVPGLAHSTQHARQHYADANPSYAKATSSYHHPPMQLPNCTFASSQDPSPWFGEKPPSVTNSDHKHPPGFPTQLHHPHPPHFDRSTHSASNHPAKVHVVAKPPFEYKPPFPGAFDVPHAPRHPQSTSQRRRYQPEELLKAKPTSHANASYRPSPYQNEYEMEQPFLAKLRRPYRDESPPDETIWRRDPNGIPKNWRYHPMNPRGTTSALLAYNYEKGRVYDADAETEDEIAHADGPSQEEVILGADRSFGEPGMVVERAKEAGKEGALVAPANGARHQVIRPIELGESDGAISARSAEPGATITPKNASNDNVKDIVARIVSDMKLGEERDTKERAAQSGKGAETRREDELSGQQLEEEAKGPVDDAAEADEVFEVWDGHVDSWCNNGTSTAGGAMWTPNDSAACSDTATANRHRAVLRPSSLQHAATTSVASPRLHPSQPIFPHPALASPPYLTRSDHPRSREPSLSMPSTPPPLAPASPPIPNGTPLRRARTRDEDDAVDSAPFPSLQEDRVGQGLSPDILDAVIKVYATHCDPNYSLPWQMRRQTQSTSSGFVISGRRILTNAHSVEHYTVVRVKKRAGDHKYIARVLATGNECDLALLTVEDESFWSDLNPLPFGVLPELQTSVIVVGYPIGGENISVTAGVVSRVEIQEYTHGASQLLGIQIDAAINSGSSGGPALNHRNEVVGIAFQSLNTGDSENIGYLVAESVVDHFLRDYEKNGKYTGFCHCGFAWQKMENSALRRCMNMGPDDSGILVRKVMKTSPAQNKLRQGDIVTAIDGTSISNAGTVPYRSGERISFHYIITTKFTGDEVCLDILRNGEKLSIKYQLRDSSENLLVPVHEHRRQPEYFTIAGLVFVALSEPYLAAEYGDKWDLKAPVRLLERLLYGSKEHIDEQVVLLSQVLNAEINIEYECVINTRVHKFNGEKLRNLAHLAKLVDECTDDFLRFDLDDEIVVVGREEALKASAEILETHCIPSACSIGELSPTSDDGKPMISQTKPDRMVQKAEERKQEPANEVEDGRNKVEPERPDNVQNDFSSSSTRHTVTSIESKE